MFSPRFDYVKVSMKLHTENAQRLSRTWYDVFEGHHNDEDGPRSAHVNSVRNNPDGTRLYIFEAWGAECEHVKELPYEVWGPHLDRLDVRVDTDVTRQGVDRLYTFIRDNKHGNRNVMLYDSKARSKRNGRDTGGFGVALGSHKSDLRITWYVRGTAGGAMEFQCAGVKLQKVATLYKDLSPTSGPLDNATRWEYLMNSVYAQGFNEIKQTIGLDTLGLQQLLRNEQQNDEEVEAKLAAIDAMVDSLPRDAVQSLLTSVQMRLF